MKRIFGLSLLLLVLSFLSTPGAWAQCNAYSNSSAFEGDLDTGGPFCGYTGDGCTECTDWNPGTGIWFRICYYDWGGIYCFYSSEYQGF